MLFHSLFFHENSKQSVSPRASDCPGLARPLVLCSQLLVPGQGQWVAESYHRKHQARGKITTRSQCQSITDTHRQRREAPDGIMSVSFDRRTCRPHTQRSWPCLFWCGLKSSVLFLPLTMLALLLANLCWYTLNWTIWSTNPILKPTITVILWQSYKDKFGIYSWSHHFISVFA